jgi:hypothetical protein
MPGSDDGLALLKQSAGLIATLRGDSKPLACVIER